MAVTFSNQTDRSESPMLIGSILTTLTHLSLHDTTNVKIRLYGAHIIGKILMKNCPALIKENDKTIRYVENFDENIKLMHEL